MERKLLTVQQLAALLGVPASWIYQRTRLGQSAIPHIKIGKYVRFDQGEVLKFFESKQSEDRSFSCFVMNLSMASNFQGGF